MNRFYKLAWMNTLTRMGHVLLILFASVLWNNALAQNHEPSKRFIAEVVKCQDSVVYVDRLPGSTVASLKSSFTMNISPFVKNSDMRLKLTAKELAHINNEFNKMYDNKWGDGLLTNSKLMARGTVDSIFKAQRDGWAYLRKRGIKEIYSFSTPIFFRNNTLCLFYWEYGCGFRCAEGEFALYKKQNGRWVKERIFYSMAS